MLRPIEHAIVRPPMLDITAGCLPWPVLPPVLALTRTRYCVGRCSTPHSMAGMNNLTSELAAADGYKETMRFFTVGMDTHCGDPKKNQTDCSKPFSVSHPHSKILGTQPLPAPSQHMRLANSFALANTGAQHENPDNWGGVQGRQLLP